MQLLQYKRFFVLPVTAKHSDVSLIAKSSLISGFILQLSKESHFLYQREQLVSLFSQCFKVWS